MSDTICSGIFAGMTRAQVTAARTSFQTALMALASGEKMVTASYQQGTGARSVTYTAADSARLENLIRQATIAINGRRRAIGVVFR